jgi:hypothetical protein
MGQHPSVTFEYTFDRPSKDVLADLQKAAESKSKLYKINWQSMDSLGVSWFSPTMRWEDHVEFTVKKSEETQCVINAFSKSTNVCPHLCGCCMPCCACIGFFGDGGKNEQHIKELFKGINGQIEVKLTATTGSH